VRTFIDHLVEHFSQTPNHQLGEQWAKDGFGKHAAPGIGDEASAPRVAHTAYAHDGGEHHGAVPSGRPVDGELGPKLAKPSRTRGRMPAHSPY
jgi:diadenosine tetraphosphatase ApaH/serine/threonine PP2A family protein phosphatase